MLVCNVRSDTKIILKWKSELKNEKVYESFQNVCGIISVHISFSTIYLYLSISIYISSDGGHFL